MCASKLFCILWMCSHWMYYITNTISFCTLTTSMNICTNYHRSFLSLYSNALSTIYFNFIFCTFIEIQNEKKFETDFISFISVLDTWLHCIFWIGIQLLLLLKKKNKILNFIFLAVECSCRYLLSYLFFFLNSMLYEKRASHIRLFFYFSSLEWRKNHWSRKSNEQSWTNAEWHKHEFMTRAFCWESWTNRSFLFFFLKFFFASYHCAFLFSFPEPLQFRFRLHYNTLFVDVVFFFQSKCKTGASKNTSHDSKKHCEHNEKYVKTRTKNFVYTENRRRKIVQFHSASF